MRKRVLFLTAVIMLSFGLPMAYGVTKDKEMTRDEMLAQLKEDLADTDEVFDAVPELKAAIGADGQAVYTYSGAALEELSKDDMLKLFSRVRQALLKIRTDNIQRQLDMVKRIQRPQRIAVPSRPPGMPSAPPSAPRTPPSPVLPPIEKIKR